MRIALAGVLLGLGSLAWGAELPAPTPPKPGKPKIVDLLPMINVEVAQKGEWEFAKKGGLHSKSGGFSVLEIPYVPPDEYDLSADFVRKSGDDGVALVLARNQKQCYFQVSGWGDRVTGLGDFKDFKMIESPITKKFSIKSGQPYSVKVEVRKDRVAGFVNGQKMSETNEPDSLKNQWGFQLLANNTVGLLAWCDVTFTSIKVAEVSGAGRPKHDKKE
jgi:hypothetical protein